MKGLMDRISYIIMAEIFSSTRIIVGAFHTQWSRKSVNKWLPSQRHSTAPDCKFEVDANAKLMKQWKRERRFFYQSQRGEFTDITLVITHTFRQVQGHLGSALTTSQPTRLPASAKVKHHAHLCKRINWKVNESSGDLTTDLSSAFTPAAALWLCSFMCFIFEVKMPNRLLFSCFPLFILILHVWTRGAVVS